MYRQASALGGVLRSPKNFDPVPSRASVLDVDLK